MKREKNNKEVLLHGRFCSLLQLRHWQWLLDTRLPGSLGEVGEWLNQAEALIVSDDIPQIMNEETASIISRKLEEHKVRTLES